ncbi:hypothetical protein IAR55_003948 [Kwoniella newhampshirensis]|uniref:PHD-type domain-containing protein n=1 Tax=Kwoniella newhampshirensis TaxID=1651941 RepID=A0AAW0YLC3_9TREE
MTETKEESEQAWGRVLICGGINWATNGRKERSANASSDLLSPQILRSLCNVKITTLITGPSANYAIVIDIYGAAYIFGKPPCPSLATEAGGIISEHHPKKISPTSVGLKTGVKWVGGAAGRSHLFLLDSDGGVWGCGNNVVGQIGLPISGMVDKLTPIGGPWTKEADTEIVQVTAGHTFSLFLTSSGKVYAAGSSECGQLGNGKIGERLVKGGKLAYDVEVPARLVQGLEKNRIVQIASGNQHSLAMDEDGLVFAWGFAGYSRLGLQDQNNRLVPTLFAGNNLATRAHAILCGPTNSIVIDRQKMLQMAGKWKVTGDGSTGQPYTYFKPIQDIMSCRVIKASCGGCTHFVTTADATGGVMTVGFGQGVLYGELGLGPDVGKSATRPQKIEPLSGIDVIDVAGGAFFTLFLAKPNAALSDIPRYPEHIDSASICLVCNEDKSEEDPLECERCDQPYHLGCLDPPLEEVPEGEWFCPECTQDADAGPDEEFRPALSEKKPKKKVRPSAAESVKEETPAAKPETLRSVTPASTSLKGTPRASAKRKDVDDGSAQGSPKRLR